MRAIVTAMILAATLAGCGSAATLAPGAGDTGAVADPSAWPTAASPAALTDPATETAITALLQRMTLEQKVGQLIQADISAITPADLARYPLGSILAGGNSGPGGNERASAQDWRRMVDAFREASRKAGAGVPILFGVDAVHGHSNLPGATIFPHNVGLGAAGDPALIERIGAVTAAEIAGSGIEWTFAPTLAVPQDVRWGRAYEGYSSDPKLVASYASAMTLGLQGRLEPGKPLGSQQVAATAKHFLADGGTADGRDQGDARLPENDLVAIHAAGYPTAIDAGALTVMASFSSWNGAKHHGNASLLTDVLKQRMGFAGLVVGDWNGHGQVPGCTATDCPAAINAGLDLFMAPDSWKALYSSTLAAAQNGKIPAARIDDAVRRILRVKFKLGLMGPVLITRGDPAQVGAVDHLALAREAVARSLVLLKNEGGVLPLRPGSRVLIAGPGADNMAMQAGGWTISWQGTDTTAADFANGQTLGRAITQAVTAAGGQAVVSPSGTYGAKPDVAVVVVGERPYAEFEGDIANLAYRPAAGELELIARLKAQGIRVVTVFLSGRPLFAGSLINQSDAFVAAWLPGTQGAGVADVLVAGATGKPPRDFTGRLSYAWPDDARAPMVKPLFPLGFGSSYAKPARLGRINADPRSPAANDDLLSYMVRGKVPAPWRLVTDGSVSTRAVDLSAQEDARQFTWTGPAAITIEGAAIDLSKQPAATSALAIEWRIDQRGPGKLRLGFGGATLDLSASLRSLTPGSVTQTRIPLRCFAAVGAKLRAVGSPLRIEADKGFAAAIRTVRVEQVAADQRCPG